MWEAISFPSRFICFHLGTIRGGCWVRRLFLNRQEIGLDDPRASSRVTSSSLCSPLSMFSLLGLQGDRQVQVLDPKSSWKDGIGDEVFHMNIDWCQAIVEPCEGQSPSHLQLPWEGHHSRTHGLWLFIWFTTQVSKCSGVFLEVLYPQNKLFSFPGV